ncbi:MAG: hypothetical protein MZV65_25500 [Chromatiales bacterium]|nr:hypothetical protein [Chromatiales bacterium]
MRRACAEAVGGGVDDLGAGVRRQRVEYGGGEDVAAGGRLVFEDAVVE